MPSLTLPYETAFALTSRRQDSWGNWSEASYTIPFSWSPAIPAGAQVSTATLTIVVSAAPAVGSYMTVDGQSVNTSVGTKAISVTVAAGTSQRDIVMTFKGSGTAYSVSQLTIASVTLSFSYVVPMSQWSLTKTSAAAGEEIGVTITPAAEGNRHTVAYALGSKSASYDLAAGVTSHSLTIPMAWCEEIPSATYGAGAITLQTLDASGTALGSETKSFTMTVPAGVIPTLESLTVTGVNLYWGLYLQGVSSALAEAGGAAGAYGSTIRSYALSGGGYASATGTLNTGTLDTAGGNVFRATVTDSRGRVSEAMEKTIEVTAYTAVTLTQADVKRCLEDGTPDDAGTYLRCVIGYEWTAVGENACLVRVSARKAGAEAWTTLYEGAPASGTALVLGDGGIQEGSSWDVLIQAADAVTADQVARKIATAHTFFLADPVNDAFAFGCYPEGEKRLRLADDWAFYTHGKELLELIYPVGSIYMSVAETSPAVLFGGEWEAIEGRFLLASGANDAAGVTGGARTHTLTKAELPAISLTTPGEPATSSPTWAAPNQAVVYRYMAGTPQGSVSVPLGGSGQAFSVMPPYLAVHVWKRVG